MTDQTSDVTAAPEAAPAPEAQSPDAPSKAARVAKGIAAWFVSHVQNSPISRHAPSLEHLQAGLESLRESILKEL